MPRHSLATLAYRLGRAVDGAPANFGEFRAGETVRTPVEILTHMGDLMDWAAGLSDGVHQWHDSTPMAWDAEVARFHAALEKLDARLAAGPILCDEKRLFQGPIPRRAAKLTHLRAPKLTHPGRGSAAAKALMGKTLSSPPAAGGGVTLQKLSRNSPSDPRSPVLGADLRRDEGQLRRQGGGNE